MYALTDVHDCYSGMVDTIFADVAQPDQARIVALNAQYFLKNGTLIHTYLQYMHSDQVDLHIHTYIHTYIYTGGHFVISIKASCIDSTAPAEVAYYY